MAEQDLFLAIDQGGQSGRALVFDKRGETVLRVSEKVKTRRPSPDRVEHDATQLVDSVQSAIRGALDQLGEQARHLKAAGLATQRSTVAFWDLATGRSLAPIISWQDRRAKEWLEALSSHGQRVHELTGLVLSPHYGASKLRWCLDHCDGLDAFRDAGTLAYGPLASFLLFNTLLEQPHLVDPANASRTLLWDYRTRNWSEDLLALFGVPEEPLPRCVASRFGFGHLSAAPHVPVTVTTGDQSAALFAFGTPKPGTAFVNLGTGAFLQCIAGSKPIGSEGLLSSVVWQDGSAALYVLEGTVNGAASALKVIGTELGITVDAMIEHAPHWLHETENPPLFLNGVSGLGSPFWVPEFASEFIGPASNREKIVAVYESIVFLLQVNLDAVLAEGLRPSRIVVTGGLASLDGLCQRLADLSGLVVERPDVQEATGRGVAFLAAGSPVTWTPASRRSVFTPAADVRLADRFRRWQTEMNRRLPQAVKCAGN